MIKDIFNSVKDNAKERTTNPFLGTFTIVLLMHHWKLLYALFNFDTESTLEHRLTHISNYLSYCSWWDGVIVPVFISLLIIILTYLLINISRFITNLYEKKLTPLIYKITDGSSVVLKSDYDKLVQKTYQLEEKVKTERTKRLEAEAERDKLEVRVMQKEDVIEVDDEETKNNENSALYKIASKINSVYSTQFQKLLVDITHNKTVSETNFVKYLISAGVLTLRVADPRRGNIYDLTEFGEEVRKEVFRIST